MKINKRILSTFAIAAIALPAAVPAISSTTAQASDINNAKATYKISRYDDDPTGSDHKTHIIRRDENKDNVKKNLVASGNCFASNIFAVAHKGDSYIARLYTTGTHMKGTLYSDDTTGKQYWLINDPSTSAQIWLPRDIDSNGNYDSHWFN